MTNEELILRSVGEIVERLVARFSAQASDHETKMAEHRAAFGARTEADRKIIAGLREDLEGVRNSLGIQAAKEANKVLGMIVGEGLRGAAERVVRERDGLLTQVQDMRAEMERLREDERKAYQAGVSLRAEVAALQERLRSSIARGDFAQMEVAALKSQTPKQHPVKVGEWVKASNGAVAQVLEVHKDWYLIARGHGWTFANCEPCDPPNHDTEAGKAVAESAVSDPVAEEIKVGDVVEVVSNTGLNTWLADVGSFGTVTSIETLEDSLSVRLKDVPDKKNVCGGYVSICDVRKVTT